MDYFNILKRALNDPISAEEALTLFRKVNSWDKLTELLKAASKVRDDEVGNEVKLMGFVASITPCEVEPPCKYCFRWANGKLFTDLDVLSDEELAEAVKVIEEKGLSAVELGGGTVLGGRGASITLRKAEIACKSSRKIDIWINNGPSFRPKDLKSLRELGVRGIACNFETLSEVKYEILRPGLRLEDRKAIVEECEKAGLGIDNTLMIGLGDWLADVEPYTEWTEFLGYFNRFRNLKIMEIHPFKPIKNSPCYDKPKGSEIETAKARAIARLMLREPYINGAESTLGLLSGANLIMHVYPICKEFRVRGRYALQAFKLEKISDEVALMDNAEELTKEARKMGFEIVY